MSTDVSVCHLYCLQLSDLPEPYYFHIARDYKMDDIWGLYFCDPGKRLYKILSPTYLTSPWKQWQLFLCPNGLKFKFIFHIWTAEVSGNKLRVPAWSIIPAIRAYHHCLWWECWLKPQIVFLHHSGVCVCVSVALYFNVNAFLNNSPWVLLDHNHGLSSPLEFPVSKYFSQIKYLYFRLFPLWVLLSFSQHKSPFVSFLSPLDYPRDTLFMYLTFPAELQLWT